MLQGPATPVLRTRAGSPPCNASRAMLLMCAHAHIATRPMLYPRPLRPVRPMATLVNVVHLLPTNPRRSTLAWLRRQGCPYSLRA